MSRINNYDELVLERRKLETTIAEQKLILREGLHDLKEKLEPFLFLVPILNVFNKKPGNHSLLKFIASFGIDLLVGQKLLSKANWLTKLLVPMVLKGVSALAIGSNTIKENDSKLVTENNL